MAIPILRIMTLKSLLGSGKYKDYTIEKLIALGREEAILKAYFVITNVSFNQEVLDLLKLTEEYQITKPGSKWERFKPVLADLYPAQFKRLYHKTKSNLEKTMTKESQLKSKSALQYKNQRS